MKKQIYYIIAGSTALAVFITIMFLTKQSIPAGREMSSGNASANTHHSAGDTHFPEEMVLISGGEFHMGTTGSYADEAPVHCVSLSAFLLDRDEGTN